MPHLEAPTGLGESSPESSLSAGAVLAPPAPAALVQIRIQTPEPIHRDVPVRVVHARRTLPRISSYDRDIPVLEEHNHWPPAVHLLPVNLPPQVTEPSLDELLRRVTERNDLQNVEAVRLRVISYSVSLSRLGLFLPRLQHLDLAGSVLSSLRDLGFGLIHLSYLNVSNCGLNSFDGTSGLPSVRVLIADDNMIQRVGPLAELPLLQRLSAQRNRISDLGLLTFLGMCPNLTELELQGNAVCHLPLYRTTLQRSVSTLQFLDGQSIHAAVSVDNENVEATLQRANSSTDGEVSSLSSEVYSESSHAGSTGEVGEVHESAFRPATAPSENQNNSLTSSYQATRPASVSVTTRRASLSTGAPISGSVIALARRNRQRQHQRGNAWASSSSSNSSSVSSTRPTSSSSGSFELKLTPMHTSHQGAD